MNREIKFRGISVDTGEWVYGSMVRGVGELVDRVYIVPAIITGYYSVCSMMDCIEVDPSTVGQYIGVKDMHGVEIYEGDIVRVEYDMSNEGDISSDYYVGKIVYLQEDAMFAIVDKYDVFIDTLEPEAGKSVQVLGNIHQHPELLNS